MKPFLVTYRKSKYVNIHASFNTPDEAKKWMDEMLAQQAAQQADEFSGHAKNCVLRSGGYACTCGLHDTPRR